MLEQLSKTAKLRKAKSLFKNAVAKDTKWQQDARDDFAFRDGDQWSAEEKQILKDELRPVLTFNLTKSSVDLIMGMNQDSKIVYRATPTEPSDGFLAEVLNDLYENLNDSSDFDEELDGGLESATICGRGYVGVDFVPDPKRFGDIEVSLINIPVSEVHFDPSARRPNIQDASYIVWDRWMTKEDFKMRYPSVTEKSMVEMMGDNTQAVTQSDPISEDGIPISDAPSADYDREMDDDITFYDRSKNMIRLVQMEYWEYYKRYYAYNPETDNFEEIPGKPSIEQKAEFQAQFGEDMTIETLFDKRVRWLQFIGDKILFDDVSPLPYAGFSIVPVFAYRDVSQRTANHFGIVRPMKDPQREINKRWSQALNMLNQQVQPGVYAETETFVDEDQALQSMKVAGDITWLNAGGLNKLKERTVPAFPQAPMQMEEFSQDILKKITGINPDLLGQDRGRQEPGVVVRMRQQQGMTLLKPLFRNFNHMKREIFLRILSIIMKYMPDSQIMRILGEGEGYSFNEQGQLIQTETQQGEDGKPQDVVINMADLRDVRDLDYNVTPEPAPGNMTQRMLELQALLEMQQNMPVPPEQIIEKMDIAETDKQKWIKYIEEQQQAEAQQQQQQMQAEMQFKDREIKVDEQKNEQDFITDMAKIKQMAEKDEKSMQVKGADRQQQKEASMRQYILEMAKLMNEMEDDDKEEGGKEKNGTK